ncbi:hypothetical protein BT93_F2976 [Corymbia citriodora subsp. variegata]|nr:hypothetical protein BT93_F2976 [Corymbia citriodora subsp. variegata]
MSSVVEVRQRKLICRTEKKKRLDIGNSQLQQTHKAYQSNKHVTPDEANSLHRMHQWKNLTKHDHFSTPVSTTLQEVEL